MGAFSNGAGSLVPYDFLVAPGAAVYSTFMGNSYKTMTGTSVATPYVAGAAAILLSARADFSSNWVLEELENIMTMSSSPLDSAALISLPDSSASEARLHVDSIDADVASSFAVNDFDSVELSLIGVVV
jgi:subtilisin family serine protease